MQLSPNEISRSIGESIIPYTLTNSIFPLPLITLYIVVIFSFSLLIGLLLSVTLDFIIFLDPVAPLKLHSVSFSTSTPWFTPNLRLLKAKSWRLERLYRKSGLAVHMEMYKSNMLLKLQMTFCWQLITVSSRFLFSSTSVQPLIRFPIPPSYRDSQLLASLTPPWACLNLTSPAFPSHLRYAPRLLPRAAPLYHLPPPTWQYFQEIQCTIPLLRRPYTALFIDYTQLYTPLPTALTAGLSEVWSWFSFDSLQLNMNKTEVLLVGSKSTLSNHLNLSIDNSLVSSFLLSKKPEYDFSRLPIFLPCQ